MKTIQAVGKQAMEKRYGINCVEFRDGILLKEEELIKNGLGKVKVDEDGLQVYVENFPVNLSIDSRGGDNYGIVHVLFETSKYDEPFLTRLDTDFALGLGPKFKDASRTLHLMSEHKIQITKDLWTLRKKDDMSEAFYKETEDELLLLCPLAENLYVNHDIDWKKILNATKRIHGTLLKQTDEFYKELWNLYEWTKSKGLNKLTAEVIKRYKKEHDTVYI